MVAAILIAYSYLSPIALIKYLPMSLATQKMAKRYEKERKQTHEAMDDEDGEMDLFSRTSEFP
jgi:hypothetical protein